MVLALNEFRPDWVSPPGETIAEILSQRNLTIDDFADELGKTEEWIEGLLAGDEEITADLANHLSQYLGASTTFWLKREAQYRNSEFPDNVLTPAEWVKELPVRDMVNYGWISSASNSAEKIAKCLDFFGVSDYEAWRKRYSGALAAAAFRTSATYEQKPAAVAAWLRQGEIVADSIPCGAWDPDRFRTVLGDIRRLSLIRNPATFLPRLQQLCAQCGVAVVVVRPPTGCKASGATRFIADDKAMMMLSFRHKTDDHFWFTFFHEAGHLLMHTDDALFLEGLTEVATDEEEEADQFSEDILIPSDHRNEMMSLSEKWGIIRFAVKLGISPGIVVGQLQHHNVIPHEKMNYLKRRFAWNEVSTSLEMQ